MKKALKIVLCATLIFALCFSFAACFGKDNGSGETELKNPIDFGKKYKARNNENIYYVFNADKTGYLETYYKYDDKNPENSYVNSARIDFVYRELSDGRVYLFETKTQYHADHTGNKITLTDSAIYFSEDLMTISQTGTMGDYAYHFVKEGSELERALESAKNK